MSIPSTSNINLTRITFKSTIASSDFMCHLLNHFMEIQARTFDCQPLKRWIAQTLWLNVIAFDLSAIKLTEVALTNWLFFFSLNQFVHWCQRKSKYCVFCDEIPRFFPISQIDCLENDKKNAVVNNSSWSFFSSSPRLGDYFEEINLFRRYTFQRQTVLRNIKTKINGKSLQFNERRQVRKALQKTRFCSTWAWTFIKSDLGICHLGVIFLERQRHIISNMMKWLRSSACTYKYLNATKWRNEQPKTCNYFWNNKNRICRKKTNSSHLFARRSMQSFVVYTYSVYGHAYLYITLDRLAYTIRPEIY